MKKLINVQKWREWLFLVFTVFAVTYFIYTDFNIRQMLGFGVLCVFLLLAAFSRIHLSSVKIAYAIFAGCLLIFFCLPFAKHDKMTISYMLAMVISVGFVIVSEPKESVIKKSLTLIQITGCVFMILLLVFRLFPALYWDKVFPLLSAVTQEEASIYIKKGYSIPLAGGYTYGNLMFSLAFFASVGRFLPLAGSTKGEKSFALLSAAAAFLGLILSGRRSELLSVIIVALLALIIYRRKLKGKKEWLKFIGGCLAVVVILALVIWVLYKMNMLTRYLKTIRSIMANPNQELKNLLGGKNDITSGRIELWKIAVEEIKGSPILGIGWARFADSIPAAFSAVHGRGVVMNVHNDYLQHLCELGVVGTIAILLPQGFLLVTGIRQARRLRWSGKKQGLIAALNYLSVCTQLFYAVLGLIDPCFYQMSYWIFYPIAIICLVFSVQMERSSQNNGE